jgi:hypothetical protein
MLLHGGRIINLSSMRVDLVMERQAQEELSMCYLYETSFVQPGRILAALL